MKINNVYSNEVDKEVKLHNIMLKYEHILNIRRALGRL